MNELTERWRSNSRWSELFDESDRLIVESLVRRVLDTDESVHLGDADDPFILALLLLARATRLDHVALSLRPAALGEHLRGLGGAEFIDVDQVCLALNATDHRLAALVERQEIDATVSPFGAPVVVTTVAGSAQYVYFRRLAYAEWRLTRALVDAQELRAPDVGGLFAGAVDELHDDVTREVAQRLAQHRISVLTGGPGTGKTTAVGEVLRAIERSARERGRVVHVALAAPTAKAAVRLRESLGAATFEAPSPSITFDVRGGSLHRLLGLRPDRDADDRVLAHDLIVIDEVSMSELPLLDQLVARASAPTRILLVGDANQLASVNVGAALRDIVDAAESGALGDLVTRLEHNWRSQGALASLGDAINHGDVSAVASLAELHGDVVLIDPPRDDAEHSALVHARALRDAAERADALGAVEQLGRFTVLAATRRGEGSVNWWNSRIEPTVRRLDALEDRFAVGAPVLVTRNESGNDPGTLSNGDLGVQLATPEQRVVFAGSPELRSRAASQLGEAEVAWAITIHKSQGSEYEAVVVSLPSHDVSILTRELLYTAVTRARESVTILASLETIERILARRIERVSGLSERAAALASNRDAK